MAVKLTLAQVDLGDTTITEPLMRRFLGQVPALSKHKFSSNVIEKCLRTAEPGLRQKFIEEMLQPQELGKLLRDPYANYVIQTAVGLLRFRFNYHLL